MPTAAQARKRIEDIRAAMAQVPRGPFEGQPLQSIVDQPAAPAAPFEAQPLQSIFPAPVSPGAPALPPGETTQQFEQRIEQQFPAPAAPQPPAVAEQAPSLFDDPQELRRILSEQRLAEVVATKPEPGAKPTDAQPTPTPRIAAQGPAATDGQVAPQPAAPPQTYADRIKATIAGITAPPGTPENIQQQAAARAEQFRIGQEQRAAARVPERPWNKPIIGGQEYDFSRMPISQARRMIQQLTLQENVARLAGKRETQRLQITGKQRIAQIEKAGEVRVGVARELAKLDPETARLNREAMTARAKLYASVREGGIASLDDYRQESLVLRGEQNARLDRVTAAVAINKTVSAAAGRADKRISTLRSDISSRERRIDKLMQEVYRLRAERRPLSDEVSDEAEQIRDIDKNLTDLLGKVEGLEAKNDTGRIEIDKLGEKYGPQEVAPPVEGEPVQPAPDTGLAAGAVPDERFQQVLADVTAGKPVRALASDFTPEQRAQLAAAMRARRGKNG